MKRKLSFGDIIFDIIIYAVMFAVFVATLYPFWYILVYSLSASGSIGTGLLLFPKKFSVAAYRLLLQVKTIPHAMLISVLRSVIVPPLSVLVTSMAAFALKHRELPGRKFISRYLLLTMYFSSGLIPSYLLITSLGLSGTFWVYVIPGLFGVYNMVLIKTYMENLPEGLEESAMIDGANEYVIYFQIMLPLCKPVLAAVLLFLCIDHWNNYTDTMIYNTAQTEYHTLSYVLMNFIQTSASSVEEVRQRAKEQTINSTALKMAMTILTTIPIMMVYPLLQKNFAAGIMIGSIKG